MAVRALETLKVEPELHSEAIEEWCAIGSNRKDKSGRARDLTLKAKKHLLALGWNLWYGQKGQRRELRYTSPSGKCYYSLRTACEGCIEEGGGGKKEFLAPQERLTLCDSTDRGTIDRVRSSNCVVLALECVAGSSNLGNFSTAKSGGGDCGTGSESGKRERKEEECEGDGEFVIRPGMGKSVKKMMALTDRTNKASDRRKRKKRECECDDTVDAFIDDETPIKRGRGKSMKKLKKQRSENAESTSFGADVLLEDGQSLLDFQKQLKLPANCRKSVRISKKNTMSGTKSSGQFSPLENDDICSVCNYGGELVLCDDCPSAFHKSCLGLSDVPEDEFWYCPQCRCTICAEGGLKGQSFKMCHQCQHKFHLDCLKNEFKAIVEGSERHWFCSTKCEQVFSSLQSLIGKQIALGAGNLTWTLLRPVASSSRKDNVEPNEIESKLHNALNIMHECFEPCNDPFTSRDLVEDVIFSRGSELRRLDFSQFFTVLLEKDDELVSVANVRVFRDLAEIPLVATRFNFRKQGLCRALMNELERQLMEMGVERLVLPAVPGLLSTWTNSFGFSRMTGCERLKLLDHSFLCFQGTIMCHRVLIERPSSAKSSVTEETLA